MSQTLERVRADLVASRKGREKLRTTVLGTLLSEVRNREIEMGASVDEDEMQRLVGSALKRRREAAEQMRAAGRDELADREDEEARLLQDYLPPQLDEGEVRSLVRDAVAGGAADVGAVMKVVMPRVKGRFEGRELNRLAREELAAQ